ncbi:MAG: trypsin-like peptidase domain-containing protein [Clostridia bacterium]|nr:trypsin-like peptidase domain-containing protein [Clostridia bacterium]
MNDYKWFKDDFENNMNKQNDDASTDSGEAYQTYSSDSAGYTSDFNTSGADYQSDSYTDPGYTSYQSPEDYTQTTTFYNTNIKPKKKRKKVSAAVLALAVVLTAAVSVTGSVYVPKLVAQFRDNNTVTTEDKSGDGKESVGAAIVAQPVADKEGNKALTTPEIVDKVGPAVVGITTKSNSYYGYGYFGQNSVEQGSGSGVLISSDGYIVTNNHVVENAIELTVILNTNETYTAKLIGTDSRTDLAVIKIEASELPHATLGVSSDLRVGDTAIAIGNPLGQEFAGTTTQGIISGLNRSVTIDNKQLNLIQTDAAINPGNSGGALVNAYGQVIGINTAKISSSSLEGLGFAIPIDEAKPIIKELIDNGYVTGRPVIGIGGRAVTEEDAKAYNLKVGVYVSSMTPDSPAYMAGVKIGDIIVECEGKKVTTVDEINDVKNKKKPGDQMKIKVYRQGTYKEITIVLGEEIPTMG